MNKTLKVMTSAALLAGVVAPVAVTTVSANSSNVVEKVVSLDDNYEWESGSPTTSIYINEDDVDFTSGDTFRLTLPTGVKWIKGEYPRNTLVAGNTDAGFEVVSITDQDLELKLVGAKFGDKKTDEKVKVPLYFKIDGADNGEVQLTVDGKDSTITSGKYTIAYVSDGATNTTIAKVSTIGDRDAIETIRIDETSVAAIYNGTNSPQEIKFKLPSKFSWVKGAGSVTVGGGFVGTLDDETPTIEFDDNELTFTLKFKSKPSSLGTIWVEGLKIDADKDASYGEIEMDIDGDEVTGQSLVVADYSDYGTSAAIKDDVPTLLAGRGNNDKKDLETVEFELKESTKGSWLPDRSVNVELPSWVKIVGVDVTAAKNMGVDKSALGKAIAAEIDGDSNSVEFDTPAFSTNTDKKSFKVKFYVSVKADASGDITAEVDGRAGIALESTVIGKAVAPVTVETKKVDVRTGIKEQALEDIIITENAKGALVDDKEVRIWLSNGEFTDQNPKITVDEGNVDIDEESINIKDGVLTFDIDSESTRASKIKISGLKLDLSRSIPEGSIDIKVGGSALVQNPAKDYAKDDIVAYDDKVFFEKGLTSFGQKDYSKFDISGTVDVGEFDQDYITKATIATVTTPAEGNVSAETVTLTIGSSTMKVGDKEVALDAAPFIEASTGRTYLPVRAIANAIGASSVEWDNASRTATVIKGGLVAQMTIGQNAYVLNGSKIGMDGKAQVVSERTFLPIRALGSALGANVEWDAATQTVTIK